MSDTTNPRDPLPADVVARLLDPKERERVQRMIANIKPAYPKDHDSLAKAYVTVRFLYRLVDQLRAENDQLARFAAQTYGTAEEGLALAEQGLRAESDLEDQAKRLEAENAQLWETIANLYDHPTDDQVMAELRRRGIKLAELPEVVRRAREKGG
jgi:phage shock protein A